MFYSELSLFCPSSVGPLCAFSSTPAPLVGWLLRFTLFCPAPPTFLGARLRRSSTAIAAQQPPPAKESRAKRQRVTPQAAGPASLCMRKFCLANLLASRPHSAIDHTTPPPSGFTSGRSAPSRHGAHRHLITRLLAALLPPGCPSVPSARLSGQPTWAASPGRAEGSRPLSHRLVRVPFSSQPLPAARLLADDLPVHHFRQCPAVVSRKYTVSPPRRGMPSSQPTLRPPFHQAHS